MPETLSNSGFPSSHRDYQGFLSIDKLSLIYDVPRMISDSVDSKNFYRLFDRIISSSSRVFTDMCLYEYHAEWNGVHVFWGRGDADPVGQTIKIEMNPNKVDWEQISTLLRVFGRLDSVLRGRVSRIDVAVDYKCELDPYMFFDTYKRKGGCIWGSNGIETVYLGMRSSDSQIRIYDKAKETRGEARDDFDISSDSSWWRVEAEIKKTYDIVQDIENPFLNLCYAKKDEFTVRPTSEYMCKFFWAYAEKHGIDNALKELPKATRYKFRKNIISSDQIQLPSSVFDEQFPTEWQKLKGLLIAYAA